MTSVHVYTRAELRNPATRPRVNTQDTYRVAAPRNKEGEDATYAVPSPCCGVVTRIPQFQFDYAARSGREPGSTAASPGRIGVAVRAARDAVLATTWQWSPTRPRCST